MDRIRDEVYEANLKVKSLTSIVEGQLRWFDHIKCTNEFLNKNTYMKRKQLKKKGKGRTWSE